MAPPLVFPPARLELRRFGRSTVFATLHTIHSMGIRALSVPDPPDYLAPGTELKLRFPDLSDVPDLRVVLDRIEPRDAEHLFVLGFLENRLTNDQMQTLTSLMDQRGTTRYPAPGVIGVDLHKEAAPVHLQGRLLDLSSSGLGVGCSDSDAARIHVGSTWTATVGAEVDQPAFRIRVGVRGMRRVMGTWSVGLLVLDDQTPLEEDASHLLLHRIRTWRSRGFVPGAFRERSAS